MWDTGASAAGGVPKVALRSWRQGWQPQQCNGSTACTAHTICDCPVSVGTKLSKKTHQQIHQVNNYLMFTGYLLTAQLLSPAGPPGESVEQAAAGVGEVGHAHAHQVDARAAAVLQMDLGKGSG